MFDFGCHYSHGSDVADMRYCIDWFKLQEPDTLDGGWISVPPVLELLGSISDRLHVLWVDLQDNIGGELFWVRFDRPKFYGRKEIIR